MRTEPGSDIEILREDNALLAARIEMLLKELMIAVPYCSKQYWTDGHGERVQGIYGFELKTEMENGK